MNRMRSIAVAVALCIIPLVFVMAPVAALSSELPVLFKALLLVNVVLFAFIAYLWLALTDARNSLQTTRSVAKHWHKSADAKEEYIHQLSEWLRSANNHIKQGKVLADEGFVNRNVELRRVAMLALGHIEDDKLREQLLPLEAPEFPGLRAEVRADVEAFRRQKNEAA